MPKPMERYTKEEIKLDFFRERIEQITLLIQGRREIKLLLTVLIWLQVGKPQRLKDLRAAATHFETVGIAHIPMVDLKRYLELLGEKINYSYLPEGLLDYYSRDLSPTNEAQNAEYIAVKPHMAKLTIQISLYLNTPIDYSWNFLREIFVIPQPFISVQETVQQNLTLADSLSSLNVDSQNIIKLIYSLFEYLSTKFSGIQEHFLKISATLFWLTRLSPVYSLEIYELLTEMFGEHKLETRSSQLYESGKDNELISCEKKGKNKNRAIIYFGLRPGAEWIISGFFPDRRLLIQQQAIAISFLRYSEQLLVRPWTINPMSFNYLLDIWFRSFLYSDNLDQMVYEKAREHRRHIGRMED